MEAAAAAAAVPEELRCKRSDGKQWRCSAPSMPDKTVCEKHYVQAKKRAASSALRASLRRSSASASAARGTTPPARMAVARPIYGRVAGEPVYVAEPALPPPPPPPRRRQPVHGLPMGNAAGARTAAVSWVPGRGLVLGKSTVCLVLIDSSCLVMVGAGREGLGGAGCLQLGGGGGNGRNLPSVPEGR